MDESLKTTPSKVLRQIHSKHEPRGLEKRNGIWHVTGLRTEFWDETSLGVRNFHGYTPAQWSSRIHQLSLPLDWCQIHEGIATWASWQRRLKDRSMLPNGCKLHFNGSTVFERKRTFLIELAFEERPQDLDGLIAILHSIDQQVLTFETIGKCDGAVVLMDWLENHNELVAADWLRFYIGRNRGEMVPRPPYR